jgi:Ca2+:H+ antiporter
MLTICLAVMAFTAEWLVHSANFVRREANIEEESAFSSFYENRGTKCFKNFAPPRWFGLFLLPLISYAGDATVAIVYYIRHILGHIISHRPDPPTRLARGEAIDLSIQFVLFWLPFFVLLAWCTGKPLTLLFGMLGDRRSVFHTSFKFSCPDLDIYQVVILVGACFLVNYVTADSKTNWAEGMAMLTFYIMIVSKKSSLRMTSS